MHQQTIIAVDVSSNKQGNDLKEALRIKGYQVYQFLKDHKINTVRLISQTPLEKKLSKAFVEGCLLSNYSFDKYIKEKNKYLLTIYASGSILNNKDKQELNTICEAVRITKDLVNEPYSYLNAVQLSNDIKQYTKSLPIKVTVWNEAKIKSEKMGGILAVNKGSSLPPTFNILTYQPQNAINKQPLVLVGKGVVFDTGGLSLKPTTNSMDMMKCDMAGAATVVGSLFAIAKLNLPYYVVGLIPAVENRPGYEAVCPGDIITMYDKTTVEVLNTDAEGRLILADALHYAKRLKPNLVIDFATLTGAAVRAVGKEAAVIMSTAPKEIVKKVKNAGNKTAERTVEFPLWDEYAQYMKSDIADLKNVSSEAGAITAGKFLQHFTNYPWIHFDIAPAFVNSPYNYRGKYATAYGVRLMCKFVKNLTKDVQQNKKRKNTNRNKSR
ncbi:MAG: leucyl aminopeptidase [Chitinophagales bacterium]|nr:leucyl aminopeptidase [Chitinophagales bacterium]